MRRTGLRAGLLATLSAGALMSGLATPAPALAGPAAVATHIVVDTASGRSLGTRVSQAGALYTIDGGTAVGPNLFHSFSAFSLGTGDTAAWVWTGGDPASITRVINRVTGGGSSFISGTIDSTALPNADFYFINPAGIVFGQGASVNVRGATYFSTASELRFADGAKFSAATPSGSTLTMASPSAFGFLGGEGDITVDGVGPTFLPGGGALSLSAANFTVENASFNAGGLDLLAVGNTANALSIADPLSDTGLVGAVNLQPDASGVGAAITVSPAGAASGAVNIGAGSLLMNASSIVATSTPAQAGGDIDVAVGQATLENASELATNGEVLSQQPGGISISATSLTLTGGSSIETAVDDANLGDSGYTSDPTGQPVINAGTIAISAGAISLDGSTIESLADGVSYVPNTVSSSAFDPLIGSPGLIELKTTAGVSLSNSSSVEAIANLVNAATSAPPPPTYGYIPTYGPTEGFRLTNSASVEAIANLVNAATPAPPPPTYGIKMNATGGPRLPNSASVEAITNLAAGPPATEGGISVNAGSIEIDDSSISTHASGGSSPAGSISLTSKTSFEMADGSSLSTTTELAAPPDVPASGGAIMINASTVSLSNATVSVSSDDSQGYVESSGGISITAPSVTLTDASLSTTSSTFETAPIGLVSGDITLTGSQLTLVNSLLLTHIAGFDESFPDEGPFESAGSVVLTFDNIKQNGGSIEADDDVFNFDDPFLLLPTSAGNIEIQAKTARFSDGKLGSISSGGSAGLILINVQDLEFSEESVFLEGSGVGEFVPDPEEGGLGVEGPLVKALGSGRPFWADEGANLSSLQISGRNFTMADGSSIEASGPSSQGISESNSINISSYSNISGGIIYLRSGGTISLNRGNILVAQQRVGFADDIELAANGQVSIVNSTLEADQATGSQIGLAGAGQAGNIAIDGGSISVINSIISSEALSDFNDSSAGNVSLSTVGNILLLDSTVSVSSTGAGGAGTVLIGGRDVTVDQSSVEAASFPVDPPDSAGGAGSVTVTAKDLFIDNGGSIGTNSGGPDPGGVVAVTAGSLLIEGPGSAIISVNNYSDGIGGGGPAGDIDVSAGVISLRDGGVISTNSTNGPAGAIKIALGSGGRLLLQGATDPGAITTTSGTDSGGKISVEGGSAIVLNGSLIQALGPGNAADVTLNSGAIIESADRVNQIAVAGVLQLDSQIVDVASSVTNVNLGFLDASQVLKGQCAARQASGGTSQLGTKAAGPYASPPPAHEAPKKPGLSAAAAHDVLACGG